MVPELTTKDEKGGAAVPVWVGGGTAMKGTGKELIAIKTRLGKGASDDSDLQAEVVVVVAVVVALVMVELFKDVRLTHLTNGTGKARIAPKHTLLNLSHSRYHRWSCS